MKSKKNKGIYRREFIEISAKTAIGIGLTSMPLLTTSCLASTTTKIVQGACYHDCPDRCSWKVTTIDNKVTDFQASQNPYTAGKLCDKMVNFPNDVTFNSEKKREKRGKVSLLKSAENKP